MPSSRHLALLAASYLAVVIFLIAPLALFCLKYNNYYEHAHWTPPDLRGPAETVAALVVTSAAANVTTTTAPPETTGNGTTTPVPTTPVPGDVMEHALTRPLTSTNGFAADIPLTLIIAPLVVILVVAHVQAVSNVVNHYQRLMRGVNRRNR